MFAGSLPLGKGLGHGAAAETDQEEDHEGVVKAWPRCCLWATCPPWEEGLQDPVPARSRVGFPRSYSGSVIPWDPKVGVLLCHGRGQVV